jgi:hypothetical protein
LLTTAQWDENEVRANLLDQVKTHFGVTQGCLYTTEVTFAKKGSAPVAVERQFSIDNCRLENCQIAVLMFYVAPNGAFVFIDAVPYLPPSWLVDPGRRLKASIPPDIRYRTKSQIATGMIERALEAGFDPKMAFFSLLCQDKMYLRHALQAKNIPYLMSLTSGEFEGLSGVEADDPRLESNAVTGRPLGKSFSGRLPLVEQCTARAPIGHRPPHSAYCCIGNHRAVSNAELNRTIAELRRMEARLRSVRSEIRLDRYEVRSWRGWHRHMTLAMVVQTAMELARQSPAEFKREAS